MKTLTAVATTVIILVLVQHFRPNILKHYARNPAPEAPPVLPPPKVVPSSLAIQKAKKNPTQRLFQPQDLSTASKEELMSAIQEPVRDIDPVHTSERAKAGDTNAQRTMGLRFADGSGVPQDYAVAMTWFAKAAERGDPDSQLKLALGYTKGIGVPQDEEQAVVWLKRAANNGNSWAQHALSKLYIAGHGVPKDYVRAYTWARIASENDGNGNEEFGKLGAQMASAQIADAERRVSIWNLHSRRNRSKSLVRDDESVP